MFASFAQPFRFVLVDEKGFVLSLQCGRQTMRNGAYFSGLRNLTLRESHFRSKTSPLSCAANVSVGLPMCRAMWSVAGLVLFFFFLGREVSFKYERRIEGGVFSLVAHSSLGLLTDPPLG